LSACFASKTRARALAVRGNPDVVASLDAERAVPRCGADVSFMATTWWSPAAKREPGASLPYESFATAETRGFTPSAWVTLGDGRCAQRHSAAICSSAEGGLQQRRWADSAVSRQNQSCG